MGAWDTGNFSNDSALDFVAGISVVGDLQRAIEAVAASEEAEIDSDIATEALAAADILASMIGRPAPDQPDTIEKLVAKFGKPPTALLANARGAVGRIREKSELRDLWEEADSEEWIDVVSDLIERLDPDAEYTAKPAPAPIKGGFICSICDEIVPDDEMVRAEFGYALMPGVTMGRYFHRQCVETNFEPPFYDEKGEMRGALKKKIKKFLAKKDKRQPDV